MTKMTKYVIVGTESGKTIEPICFESNCTWYTTAEFNKVGDEMEKKYYQKENTGFCLRPFEADDMTGAPLEETFMGPLNWGTMEIAKPKEDDKDDNASTM